MNTLLILLQLYFPAIVFLMCIISIFRIRKKDDSLKLKVPILGIASYEWPVRNKVTVKLIYIAIILLSILWYLWMIDFTNLFPDKLKVKVSFDRNGIERTLNEIGISEVNGIKIDINDSSLKRQYIKERDGILFKYLKITKCLETTLYGDLSKLSCSGETNFIVKKKGGFHNYLIEESRGYLKFSFFVPHKNEQAFKVNFELLPSSNDKIDFSVRKHLFKNEIVLAPAFRESLLVEQDSGTLVRNDHELFGITKLTFFPVPSPSNTLYIYKVNDKLIPVCYAANIEE